MERAGLFTVNNGRDMRRTEIWYQMNYYLSEMMKEGSVLRWGKKGKFVPVSTLGDLTDLLNHNCRALEKRLTKLARRNRGVAVLAHCRVTDTQCGRRWSAGNRRNRSISFLSE